MASRTRVYFLNALSLTLTALIMRGVAVIFNVYVAKTAGSEAMGLYSLLGSVYSFSITVGTAGINLGTTRLISECIGLGDYSRAKASMRKALLCCTVTGMIATALLYAFSPMLASYLLSDVRAEVPLRILSVSLTPIALCSCLSGYFTAVRRVKISSFSQIFVQIIRIVFTFVSLSILGGRGAEEACVALVLGTVAAELSSLCITFLLYIFDKRKLDKNPDRICVGDTGIVKQLLSITLPVTFSACIRSALTMLQHTLVPKGLKASGRSWSEALSSYGALHSMAMPLVLFPSALISGFAGLLIPEISECKVQNDKSRLERVSYRSLSLSLFFSIGISGIMVFYSHELGMLLYDSAETARYIRIMAPLIPVMYIDGAVDAILKGMGYQVYSMNVNIADTLTACIFALTLIPHLGMLGYVISIYATEILNTTLSLGKLLSVSGMRPRIFHQVVMPIFCVIGATNLSRIALYGLLGEISGGIALTCAIAITLVMYAALLFITRTVGDEEKEFLAASLMSSEKYDRKYRSIKSNDAV